MNSGEVLLVPEAPVMDLLLAQGGGSLALQFEGAEPEPVTIMRPGNRRPALNCNSCGAFVIITNPDYADTECLVCKAPMPAGIKSCPECGWTYEEQNKAGS